MSGLKISSGHELFREYVDEPSVGFLSSDQVARALEYGFDQWRDIVRRHNPHIFNRTVEFHSGTPDPSNYNAIDPGAKPQQYSLDLGSGKLFSSINNPGTKTAIMGPSANIEWSTGVNLLAPPIDTILDIYLFNKDTRARAGRLRKLQGHKALELSAIGSNYVLHGTVLQFNSAPPESMILEYFPRPLVKDFSYTNTTDYFAGGIMPQFHELIVLLAAKRYLIRDGEPNQMLLGELAGQAQGMVEYLSGTQLAQSRGSVTVTTQF